MALVLHIVIAMVSVLFTTYVYVSPSATKLKASYGLIALTIASGTYLIVTTPAHMIQACMTGMAYIGINAYCLVTARQKLAVATEKKR